MPIYEYRCSSCGFQKEYLQKVSDPLLKVCPECSKETFGKMLTAAGFQLKGGGWYATDFKNSGAKPTPTTASKNGTAGKSESDAASAGESKGESKRESKGESKGEAKPAAAAASAATASTAKTE
ncbi:MAG: zinc ribbon domain-containing protein [Sulfuricaulis sp.]|nr:zinc ribbon domain-containing protein [Sulfuricaulis sp.]